MPSGHDPDDAGVLLWDFDGTLGERPGKWSAAVLDAISEELPAHGCTMAMVSEVLSAGFPWHVPEVAHPELAGPEAWWEHVTGVLASAIARLGIAPDSARCIAGRVRAHYTDVASWRLYPDALPSLAALSMRGWRHVVVSNHVPELPAIAAALGIADQFDAIVNSAATGYEKPHPEAFRLALAAAGHPRSACMIGDNPVADIAGAARAGIPAILVRADPRPGIVSCRDLSGVARIIEAARMGMASTRAAGRR